ncbi:MAG: hypothetical protein ACRYFX_22125 [Janthinobacterium lividum]
MLLRLRSSSLLAALLLLGTLSCSKKQEDDPTPAVASDTGSYKLDGQLVTCPKVTVFEYPNRGGLGADELQIQLIQPVTATSTGDNMLLSFLKNGNAPVSTYYLKSATHLTGLSTNNINWRLYNMNCQFTIASTASGGYTGTFSCTSPGTGWPSASQLTEGVFTNVHP